MTKSTVLSKFLQNSREASKSLARSLISFVESDAYGQKAYRAALAFEFGTYWFRGSEEKKARAWSDYHALTRVVKDALPFLTEDGAKMLYLEANRLWFVKLLRVIEKNDDCLSEEERLARVRRLSEALASVEKVRKGEDEYLYDYGGGIGMIRFPTT